MDVGNLPNPVSYCQHLRSGLTEIGCRLTASQVSDGVANFEPSPMKLKEVCLWPGRSNLLIAVRTDELIQTLRPTSEVGDDLNEVVDLGPE